MYLSTSAGTRYRIEFFVLISCRRADDEISNSIPRKKCILALRSRDRRCPRYWPRGYTTRFVSATSSRYDFQVWNSTRLSLPRMRKIFASGLRRRISCTVSIVYEIPFRLSSMSETANLLFPRTARRTILRRCRGAADARPRLWGGRYAGMNNTRSSLSCVRACSAIIR